MRFLIAIEPATSSGQAWGVAVPDLPGCFSAGDTLEDALTNVVEAIEMHRDGLVLDGEPIPATSHVAEHLVNPDYQGFVWMFVDACVGTGKGDVL